MALINVIVNDGVVHLWGIVDSENEKTLRFRRPIGLGDTVTVRVTATGKDAAKCRVTFDCEVTNQKGETVIEGAAEVIAPTQKICRERIPLPEVEIHEPEGGKPTAKSCPVPAVPPAAQATSKVD